MKRKKKKQKQPHRNPMVAQIRFRKAGRHGKSNKQERAGERSHKKEDSE